MVPTTQVIVTIVGSILASSGLWAWVMKKSEKRRKDKNAYRACT